MIYPSRTGFAQKSAYERLPGKAQRRVILAILQGVVTQPGSGSYVRFFEETCP